MVHILDLTKTPVSLLTSKINLGVQEFLVQLVVNLEKKIYENSFISAGGFVMKIQKGDLVKVISGKDSGKQGKVLQAFPKKGLFLLRV